MARTSNDTRKGLTAFLFHKDQPGWHIKRRIPIMGPEEHGGHCELIFEGLEIPDENRLMEVGDGLKVTQIRLGPARLTHCMRCWVSPSGLWKLRQIILPIAKVLASSWLSAIIQIKMGELAHEIQIGRLLVMHAAWSLDQGHFARKEISSAKIHVANTLHKAVDTAIQLNGARGYAKDTPLEWIYRYARQAALLMVLMKCIRWCWHVTTPNRVMITGNGADIGMISLAEDCGPVLAWLQSRTGADRLDCLRVEKLSGGAIQENWLLQLRITGGHTTDTRAGCCEQMRHQA